MKTQQFLAHHGIASNPFADEDAQTDPVFKDHCIVDTYHPSWDKVYGNPAEPSTAIVLGEKGAGKTAIRLQIQRHLSDYNADHPEGRLFVIEYDDFNPFLDRFADTVHLRRRPVNRLLGEWRLWDHMDAILTLGTTRLVDQIVGERRLAHSAASRVRTEDLIRLDCHQARDLLLLAACYDQSTAETANVRWNRLRRKLRFRTWRTWWDRLLGVAAVAVVAAMIVGWEKWGWLKQPWPYLAVLVAWLPWLVRWLTAHRRAHRIVRQVRVGNRKTRTLRSLLLKFTKNELLEQPLPVKRRTDDRYELLLKLQGVLDTLGFTGVIVLVDRVDEPHLINGSAERMRTLVWSMLDNKFLKQPGLGLKLLLPIELAPYLQREDRSFYQRARLDKQNLVPTLDWTGQALFDVANARIKACAQAGKSPTLRDLFDASVPEDRLLDALRSLRVPRHLFKFMYRLLVVHCNAHTDQSPAWKISSETFEPTLAVYLRDQDAVDRGLQAG